MAIKKLEEVADEFEGVEFDDADNVATDITPVEEVHEVEDLGVDELVVPEPPKPQLSTTQSFWENGTPVGAAGVEDLGVQTVEQDAETFDVAVTEDIGPVFYGSRELEMKKGHLYRVPPEIYHYLYTRGKLVGQ